MRPLLLIPVLLLATSTAYAQASASRDPAGTSAATKPSAQAAHPASDPQWGPVPTALPPGAEIAVLQGDPHGEGVYTLRLKLPDGYIIPPHFHPTDEMVTVVSGNLRLGMGDQVDEKNASTLKAGGFVTANKGMHHFAIARGETIVQVHGQGPFAITYVNPKDDPRVASRK
jgi:quercetin dioxygenase-like cupin family protein